MTVVTHNRHNRVTVESAVNAPPSPEWIEAANRLSTIANQLANVVHEVNNMLQIISGSAELLQMDEGASAATVRRAATIIGQSRRAAELLGELLAFSRGGGGAAGPVDLKELVERALALRHYSMTKAQIRTAIDAAGGCRVAAERRQLMQIVLNLLMNAEQALTGIEDATLGIAIAPRGDLVELTMEDNGPGLAERAALPSFAPEGGAGKAPIRLGIGLIAAEWLAREQGGTLTLEARSPRGTRARLVLPSS